MQLSQIARRVAAAANLGLYLAGQVDTCRLRGCPFPRWRRGWCSMHYQRVLKWGGPGPVGRLQRAEPLEDRFVNHVQQHGPVLQAALGPCHVWTGCVHPSGFGILGRGSHSGVYAHRYAWERAYGAPPYGNIRQLCGNRLCVRPEHLVLRRDTRDTRA